MRKAIVSRIKNIGLRTRIGAHDTADGVLSVTAHFELFLKSLRARRTEAVDPAVLHALASIQKDVDTQTKELRNLMQPYFKTADVANALPVMLEGDLDESPAATSSPEVAIVTPVRSPHNRAAKDKKTQKSVSKKGGKKSTKKGTAKLENDEGDGSEDEGETKDSDYLALDPINDLDPDARASLQDSINLAPYQFDMDEFRPTDTERTDQYIARVATARKKSMDAFIDKHKLGKSFYGDAAAKKRLTEAFPRPTDEKSPFYPLMEWMQAAIDSLWEQNSRTDKKPDLKNVSTAQRICWDAICTFDPQLHAAIRTASDDDWKRILETDGSQWRDQTLVKGRRLYGNLFPPPHDDKKGVHRSCIDGGRRQRLESEEEDADVRAMEERAAARLLEQDFIHKQAKADAKKKVCCFACSPIEID